MSKKGPRRRAIEFLGELEDLEKKHGVTLSRMERRIALRPAEARPLHFGWNHEKSCYELVKTQRFRTDMGGTRDGSQV